MLARLLEELLELCLVALVLVLQGQQVLQSAALDRVVADILEHALQLGNVVVALEDHRVVHQLAFVRDCLGLATLKALDLVQQLLGLFAVLLANVVVKGLDHQIDALHLGQVEPQQQVKHLVGALVVLAQQIGVQAQVVAVVARVQHAGEFAVEQTIELVPLFGGHEPLQAFKRGAFFDAKEQRHGDTDDNDDGPECAGIGHIELLGRS